MTVIGLPLLQPVVLVPACFFGGGIRESTEQLNVRMSTKYHEFHLIREQRP
jgi:hypothetical protein